MVRLVTAEDAFGAKVLAARLGVEGIIWELRGGVDGPYPLGPVQVFVTEEDLAEARAVLASTTPLDDGPYDDDEGHDTEDTWRTSVPRRRALVVGVAAVALLGLACAELLRVLLS
jgi:hypothetical protein